MANHKHHSCSCNHDDVKYCKTCRLVHCLGCGQEWKTQPTYWYYPQTYPSSPTITYTTGGTNNQSQLYGQGQVSGTLNQGLGTSFSTYNSNTVTTKPQPTSATSSLTPNSACDHKS